MPVNSPRSFDLTFWATRLCFRGRLSAVEDRFLTATVIIPARFGSTRFPAKILASETGRPLVQHVVDQVRKCMYVREIIVATDDQRIADALRPYDTRCVLTSPSHQSGTDRIAEVARTLEDDIIVNVQGDEPEIEPGIVDKLIERLEHSNYDMATAATPFPPGADVNNPNVVKVVMDKEGYALYFSRAPIPYARDAFAADGGMPAGMTAWRHIGLYAYRAGFLRLYGGLTPCEVESLEALEQLRVLWHGYRIAVAVAEQAPAAGVDTPEDLTRVREVWASL
jgi:3-deoxy-manno-octulosonate cytidylyltransferase (CMP-KDO synthetase)